MYVPLMPSSSSSSSVFSLPSLRYMGQLTPGMMIRNCTSIAKRHWEQTQFVLLKDIKVIPKRGLRLYAFMNRHHQDSPHLQSKKNISVEPLIEHIKSVFRIDPLPARGFHVVSAIVLISVLLYQIMWYTITVKQANPIQNQ